MPGILPPPPTDAWSFDEMPLWVTLPASATGGTMTIMEHLARPGGGPPLHLHEREDETFHILEGRFRLRLGDAISEVGPGQSAFLPRGVVHTWKCISDMPGRMMLIITPSGFENFFRENHVGRFRMPEDGARIGALAAQFGCHLVGPPLD